MVNGFSCAIGDCPNNTIGCVCYIEDNGTRRTEGAVFIDAPMPVLWDVLENSATLEVSRIADFESDFDGAALRIDGRLNAAADVVALFACKNGLIGRIESIAVFICRAEIAINGMALHGIFRLKIFSQCQVLAVVRVLWQIGHLLVVGCECQGRVGHGEG